MPGTEAKHTDCHSECADNLQWLTTKFIHRHNCQYGKGEVDNSDNNGLQQRHILVLAPSVLNTSGRVVQHHIDADKLLEDGEHNAD